MNNQAYLFVMFIINGILVGFLFDIFRILRKSFKTNDFLTYIEDITFWILTGILTLHFIFKYNNGEIRLYIFVGIILGILIYMITLSRYFIKCSVTIISFIKNIIIKIVKIIIFPFKLVINILKKILFRPIFFIFINIKKIFSKNKANILKLIKKSQKITKNAS